MVFANRRTHRPRTRVTSETVIRKRESPPRVQYIEAPPPPPPPPPFIEYPPAPSLAAPPSPRIELVSVEEEAKTNPRASRTSVSKKSRHGSRGGEEVYIERERETVRLPPPEPPAPEYETFRYVEGPTPHRHVEEDRSERRRSRSITYESNPRVSNRITERERVVVEDGGRRREYYRRP